MNIVETVGIRIKNKRLKLKLTQEQLAELCGLSANYIGRVERGTNQAKLTTYQNIATNLNSSVGELFNGL